MKLKMNDKRIRPRGNLYRTIKNAVNDGLELIPLNNTLIACTPDQRDKYLEENKKSKVFKRNYDLLREALLEKTSVTYWGRNLYKVPFKEPVNKTLSQEVYPLNFTVDKSGEGRCRCRRWKMQRKIQSKEPEMIQAREEMKI